MIRGILETVMNQKLLELYKKKNEAETKLKDRLGRFRGVAHESASGELAYSEIKVLEDYIESLKSEIQNLEARARSSAG